MFVEHKRSTYMYNVLVVCWGTGIRIVDYFCLELWFDSSTLREVWGSQRVYRASGQNLT